MGRGHRQIGEVAERTGLSLRTIRYYEEVGLVRPTARTDGGFRLYSDADITRLQVVRRMKPLDFSLEEMRELLTTLDTLDSGTAGPTERDRLLERLDSYHHATQERCESLRRRLAAAEDFAAGLRDQADRHRPSST